MVIKETRKQKDFGDVGYGEVFFARGGYHMKIRDTYCNDCGDYDNAVLLSSGEPGYFKLDASVEVMECELVIK